MSQTDNVNTLGKFLRQTGAKYRVFDMGRRIVKLSADEFVGFEAASRPYPYPFQRSAMFGVIFWHPEKADKHYVWFLKFPLDEQGLLIQASRDEFLVMLLDRVGECMLAANDGQLIEGALKDSPYTFTPREDKMAAFNAQCTKSLGLKPSQYYQAAQAYFTDRKKVAHWHHLGMQGVADVATRLDNQETVLGLIETIPFLPQETFNILCSFMENAEPTAGLVEVLAQKVDIQLQDKTPDPQVIASCLRAASNSPARGLVDSLVTQVLKNKVSNHIEILAVIVGRLWETLKQPQRCKLFIDRLGENDSGYPGFSQLLADLMYMPGMREPVMAAIRDPNRSQQLSRYVGQMFGTAK